MKMMNRYILLFILVCFFGCGGSGSSYNKAEALILRVHITTEVESPIVNDAIDLCLLKWNANQRFKAKIIGMDHEPHTVVNNQKNHFWHHNKHWKFKNSSQVWMLIADKVEDPKVYGLAIPDSYRHNVYNALTMIWFLRQDDSRIDELAEVCCHEWAHTVGYRHHHGNWKSKASKRAVNRHFMKILRKRISKRGAKKC